MRRASKSLVGGFTSEAGRLVGIAATVVIFMVVMGSSIISAPMR